MDPLELTFGRWLAGTALWSLSMLRPAAAQQSPSPPGIDRRAPVQTRDSVLVQAPPAQVWAALTDISRWPARYDFIEQTQPPAALRAGERFRWRTTKLKLTSQLLLVAPPQQLGWRGRKYGVTVYHFWYLLPQGAATLLVSEESQGGLPVTLFRNRFRQQLQAGSRLWLQQLKAAAEAPPLP